MNPYEALNPFRYSSAQDHRITQQIFDVSHMDSAISRTTFRIVDHLERRFRR